MTGSQSGNDGAAPDASAKTGRHRRLPTLTVVLMAIVVICPVLPIAMSSLGWQGTIGMGVLTQPVLGLIGGVVALFYRSVDFSTRVAWAAISSLSGFFLLFAWLVVSTLLFGP